ncbi:MAG: hypothetical protein M3P83_01980 [Actinomycetota bacterium]|nr:hypothetical protein [Actinomycetota bacterium]
MSGLATIAAVPPDEQLPEASCAELDAVSRVVHEVPEPPVSHDYLAYRIDCATSYLALGDDRGLSIRGLVWERLGDGWQHTRRVKSLAKSSGMAADELGWWSQRYPELIPGWDHPDVQERLSGTGRRCPCVDTVVGLGEHREHTSSRTWVRSGQKRSW